jgi:Cof subfamily protein (haloacid dehalogenase superfamily)
MKLIAIDLDGTLLSEDGTISRENRNAIVEAQRQGYTVAISTGRSLHDTQHILKSSELDCPIISGNGTIIFHSGKMIHRKNLLGSIVADTVTMLKNNNFYFELYTNDGVCIQNTGRDQIINEMRRVQAEGDQSFLPEWGNRQVEIQFEQHGIYYVEDFNHIDFTEADIYKIFVFSFDRSKLAALRDSLKGRVDISLTTSGWMKLEIAHPETSKGQALANLAEILDIPLKDTVAIGDNLNDLSMIQTAGIGIAMGNAEDEVKRQSTYVTRRCEENGVAYAFKEFIL